MSGNRIDNRQCSASGSGVGETDCGARLRKLLPGLPRKAGVTGYAKMKIEQDISLISVINCFVKLERKCRRRKLMARQARLRCSLPRKFEAVGAPTELHQRVLHVPHMKPMRILEPSKNLFRFHQVHSYYSLTKRQASQELFQKVRFFDV